MDISEFLRPEAIILNLRAQTSSEVIRALGNNLRDLGYVNDDFVEAALAREARMPTGLPLAGSFNAAIPHVDIEYVRQSALALATLEKPVIFQNMVDPEQDVPVQLVIMLALDQPKSQIAMLQQIAGILQNPELIAQLMAATTAQQILAALAQAETSA